MAALTGELGELADHYQRLDEFEEWSEEKRREVGYEYVDILLYLFRLASGSLTRPRQLTNTSS